MSITQDQIRKISIKLAKIRPEDEEKLLQDCNNILSYIELLNEVNTNWVEATVSVIQGRISLREDQENSQRINPKELLKCSNQKIINDQITVSNIMR